MGKSQNAKAGVVHELYARSRNMKSALGIPARHPFLIGGPVRNSPGFPLKACGNDETEIASANTAFWRESFGWTFVVVWICFGCCFEFAPVSFVSNFGFRALSFFIYAPKRASGGTE